MFHEVADEPGSRSPEELYEHYEAELLEAIEAHGVAAVAEESGVDESKLRALQEGEEPELTLEEGSAILAVLEDEPDAESIAMTVRDHLMMGMSIAVLDVEAVQSGINGEMEAKEIQSKLEGRFPMTLKELAILHQYIESKKP